MENSTHECGICGRIFDAVDAPVICNKCLNDAHRHRGRPEPDRPCGYTPTPEEFRKTWSEYEKEYE